MQVQHNEEVLLTEYGALNPCSIHVTVLSIYILMDGYCSVFARFCCPFIWFIGFNIWFEVGQMQPLFCLPWSSRIQDVRCEYQPIYYFTPKSLTCFLILDSKSNSCLPTWSKYCLVLTPPMLKGQTETPCFAHTLQAIEMTPYLEVASSLVQGWQCMPLHPLW